MKKIIFLFLLAICFSSCVSVEKYNAKIAKNHAVIGLHKDVDKAYSQLQKFHPKLYQYITKPELDSKFKGLKNQINQPMSSKAFYERLALVLKEIRQGHLMARPPNQKFTKAELKALRKKKFEFNDLDFEILENRIWVKATMGVDTTIVGDEVLAVEKELTKNLVNKYKALSASDGFNSTYYDRFVGRNFSNFYYTDKGFKDSLNLLLRKNDSIYFRTLSWINKGQIIAKTEDSLTRPRKLTSAEKFVIKKEQKAKKKAGKTRGYVPQRDYYLRNFDFIGNDNSVAYLKIRGFGDGNQKRFYRETFAKIDSTKTSILILDLRDNGGGSIDEIENLYSYLALKPFQLVNKAEIKTKIPATKSILSNQYSGLLDGVIRVMAVPGLVAYDLFHVKKIDGKRFYNLSNSKFKKPKKNNYRGKLYVLINGYSFSAASILSTNLQATQRAIFVGEETGGSYNGTVAGQYKYVTLPNSKVRMKLGLMQIEAPFQTTPNGYGIQPDIEIIPTPKDRLLKRDPELEWVLKENGKN